MVVYTIASGKGGVGKTIYSINTAIAMADLGLNTLLIDSDIAMADIGVMINISPNKNASLHEVLTNKIDPMSAIIETPYGVDVLPSGTSIKGFKNSNPDEIRNVIDKVSMEYDAVIIDTPSGLSKEVIASLAKADKVILITTPELPSITDTLKTKIMANAVHIKIEGVVLNRVMNIKDEITIEKAEEILKEKVIGTIPYDIDVIKSVLSKVPIIRKSPNSNASISIKKIARNITNIPEKEKTDKEKTDKEKISEKKFGFFDKIDAFLNR